MPISLRAPGSKLKTNLVTSTGLGGGGVSVPSAIVLSASQFLQGVAAGANVGNFSVANGQGNYTFSLLTNAGNRVSLTNNSLLTGSGAAASAAGTYQISVEATPSGAGPKLTQTFTITVGTAATPANLTAPIIQGTMQEGQILTADYGTWSNSPTSYTVQWKRDGVNISGAVNATRTMLLADVGATITVAITAINATGSATATSAGRGPVIAATIAVPVATTAPVITKSGTTLTTTAGIWDNAPTSFTYQWRKNGVDVVGATGINYTLTSGDYETPITCRVFATNAGGSTGATSNEITTATPSGIILNTLGLTSASFTSADPTGTVVGTITSKTPGSTLAINPANPRFKIVNGQIQIGNTITTVLADTDLSVTIRETLAGATNSPNYTTLQILARRNTALTDNGVVASNQSPTYPAAASGLAVQMVSGGTSLVYGVSEINHISGILRPNQFEAIYFADGIPEAAGGALIGYTGTSGSVFNSANTAVMVAGLSANAPGGAPGQIYYNVLDVAANGLPDSVIGTTCGFSGVSTSGTKALIGRKMFTAEGIIKMRGPRWVIVGYEAGVPVVYSGTPGNSGECLARGAVALAAIEGLKKTLGSTGLSASRMWMKIRRYIKCDTWFPTAEQRNMFGQGWNMVDTTKFRSGYFYASAAPSTGQTIIINGTTLTAGTEFAIGSVTATLDNLVTYLNATSAFNTLANYYRSNQTLFIVHKTAGNGTAFPIATGTWATCKAGGNQLEILDSAVEFDGLKATAYPVTSLSKNTGFLTAGMADTSPFKVGDQILTNGTAPSGYNTAATNGFITSITANTSITFTATVTGTGTATGIAGVRLTLAGYQDNKGRIITRTTSNTPIYQEVPNFVPDYVVGISDQAVLFGPPSDTLPTTFQWDDGCPWAYDYATNKYKVTLTGRYIGTAPAAIAARLVKWGVPAGTVPSANDIVIDWHLANGIDTVNKTWSKDFYLDEQPDMFVAEVRREGQSLTYRSSTRYMTGPSVLASDQSVTGVTLESEANLPFGVRRMKGIARALTTSGDAHAYYNGMPFNVESTNSAWAISDGSGLVSNNPTRFHFDYPSVGDNQTFDAVPQIYEIRLSALTNGTGGNAITLASTGTAIDVSATTLQGGDTGVAAGGYIYMKGSPGDGNTLTINGVVYTFKTSATVSSPGHIKIGSSDQDTMQRLRDCIHGSGGITTTGSSTWIAPSSLPSNWVAATFDAPLGTNGVRIINRNSDAAAITVTSSTANIKVHYASTQGETSGHVKTNTVNVNTQPADGATLTIGPTVYTFRTTVAALGEVKIGASTATTTTNLISAINNVGGTNGAAGEYFVSAAHTTALACQNTSAITVKPVLPLPVITKPFGLMPANEVNNKPWSAHIYVVEPGVVPHEKVATIGATWFAEAMTERAGTPIVLFSRCAKGDTSIRKFARLANYKPGSKGVDTNGYVQTGATATVKVNGTTNGINQYDEVYITGFSDPTANGIFKVTSDPVSSTFSIACPGKTGGPNIMAVPTLGTPEFINNGEVSVYRNGVTCTMTHSGGIATIVTNAGAGDPDVVVGDQIEIYGANEAGFNGTRTVLTAGVRTYTVALPTNPGATATGSLVMMSPGDMTRAYQDVIESYEKYVAMLPKGLDILHFGHHGGADGGDWSFYDLELKEFYDYWITQGRARKISMGTKNGRVTPLDNTQNNSSNQNSMRKAQYDFASVTPNVYYQGNTYAIGPIAASYAPFSTNRPLAKIQPDGVHATFYGITAGGGAARMGDACGWAAKGQRFGARGAFVSEVVYINNFATMFVFDLPPGATDLMLPAWGSTGFPDAEKYLFNISLQTTNLDYTACATVTGWTKSLNVDGQIEVIVTHENLGEKNVLRYARFGWGDPGFPVPGQTNAWTGIVFPRDNQDILGTGGRPAEPLYDWTPVNKDQTGTVTLSTTMPTLDRGKFNPVPTYQSDWSAPNLFAKMVATASPYDGRNVTWSAGQLATRFSDGGLNTWGGRRRGKEVQSYVDPDMGFGCHEIDLVNDTLTLVAKRVTPSPASGGKYAVSGMLNSAPSFKARRGYWELVCKLPTEKGTFIGWWNEAYQPNIPVGQETWPPEIDFMEHVSNSVSIKVGSIYYTIRDAAGKRLGDLVHKKEVKVVGSPTIPGVDLNDFHTYGCIWEAGPTGYEKFSYYFDDVEIFSELVETAYLPYDMQFIVDLAMGGDWAGPPEASWVESRMVLKSIKFHPLV